MKKEGFTASDAGLIIIQDETNYDNEENHLSHDSKDRFGLSMKPET